MQVISQTARAVVSVHNSTNRRQPFAFPRFDCEERAFAALLHQSFYSAGRGDIQNINVKGESAEPVGQGDGESAEAWQPAGFGHFRIECLKELLPRARRQRGQGSPP